MTNEYELNTRRFMDKYRVSPGMQSIGEDNVIDFKSVASMADRVMEEIGDSLPLEIIEGGKTEETPNDRNVRVERIGPKNLPQIVWEMVYPAGVKIKFKNNILSFFHRGNNTPNTTSGGSDK